MTDISDKTKLTLTNKFIADCKSYAMVHGLLASHGLFDVLTNITMKSVSSLFYSRSIPPERDVSELTRTQISLTIHIVGTTATFLIQKGPVSNHANFDIHIEDIRTIASQVIDLQAELYQITLNREITKHLS
jgi:hypothetical protein